MGPSIVFITSCILDKDDDNVVDHKYNDIDRSVGDKQGEEAGSVITIVASQRRQRQQSSTAKTAETKTTAETSTTTDEDDEALHDYDTWRIDCPLIPGRFTGTGDVTAALLLGHLAKNPNNLPLVMEKVINTMYLLILRTNESKGTTVQSTELKLIQSKDIIEHPPMTYKAKRLAYDWKF
jgi:pyridoxal/pyridoxine/pyridoxamine kinase